MKKDIPPLYFLLFWACIFMLVYLISYFQNKKADQILLKNKAFTSGNFTGETQMLGRPPVLYYMYTYQVNNKTYSDDIRVPVISNLKIHLGNRFFKIEFPVIYDSLKPETSRMLIFSDDFKRLNLSLPDELKWTDKYH